MYGKIFESMYDGTLYGQWQAIITFQQLIVLADQEGFVDLTPPAIAARTSIPLKIIERGISILESEDPYSRTEGENGKRILRMNPDRPWGWQIVNYKKYRNMASQDHRRAYMREYMRKYRVNTGKHELALLNHTNTNTDTNSLKRKTLIPKDFALTDEMKEYAKKLRYIGNLDSFTENFIDSCHAHGYKYVNFYKAWQTWLRKDIKDHPENQEVEVEMV